MKTTLYGLAIAWWLLVLPQPLALAGSEDQTTPEIFAGAATLDRPALIGAVLERNPSVEAARQAWRAAAEREVQVRALDDPRVSNGLAPLSIGGADRLGVTFEATQMIPYPGKRGLRGAVARAEAEAMEGDYHAVRLELASMVSMLFDDYYRVSRALEINAQHQELVSTLKESAEAQYVVGRASLQDPLQAEVELAQLEHDAIVLEAERRVVQAQMNELLHRGPDAPLPPPPVSLPLPGLPASSVELQQVALELRPALGSASARIRGRESAVVLAKKDFYPDFHLMGSYNSMWMSTEHQWMAGVAINLPTQRDKRRAALREAEAMLASAQSDQQRLQDQIRSEVEQVYHLVVEAHHIVELHQNRLIPAARDQVEAARAGFDSGKNSFVAVIEAEKNLRTVELRYQEAIASYYQRLARLDRAVGRIPFSSSQGGLS